jgi:hypothetical protein
MIDNLISWDCNDGQYAVGDTCSGTCDTTCISCIGPDKTDCTECDTNLKKVLKDDGACGNVMAGSSNIKVKPTNKTITVGKLKRRIYTGKHNKQYVKHKKEFIPLKEWRSLHKAKV